jgi:hypothetical protein
MAYTRQYPNSITPNGSTVRDCLENDDKELKRMLDMLSNVGGLQLSGTKRQCILYGSTDSSGNPNFLTASGLKISIDGSSVPIILSLANGFSTSSGTVDTLSAITSAVTDAWTVPASGTYYLYIDKDISTGLLSYGYTAFEDTYSKAAPSSPTLDQCYFNTNDMKMYHYNGTSWEQKLRVFVGKAVSDTSTVTVTHYHLVSRIPIENEVNVSTLAKAINLDDIYAKLASPALTGTPTAPTAAAGTNTDQIATMAALMTALKSITTAADVTWSADGKTFSCPSLGIAGLMATNGYVSFGKLFGGLILQWGIAKMQYDNGHDSYAILNYPVTFTQILAITAIGYSSGNDLPCVAFNIGEGNLTHLYMRSVEGAYNNVWYSRWIAIGK